MSNSGASKTEQPHYHGHRDRLRQRFAENGPDALADYELLELLLFTAIPRRDVKPLAKDILAKFGSFSAALAASIYELQDVKGISENTAITLKAVQAISHRMMKFEVAQQPVLGNWSRLVDYCQTTMAHEKRENFRVLFLNRKNELLADEIQQTGTVDHTLAYPREIMKRALDLGATALILCHNHPSGDTEPSRADVDLTLAVKEACKPFSITLHDHIIVSHREVTSMRNMGLI
jgi:DNA repair protein RadC